MSPATPDPAAPPPLPRAERLARAVTVAVVLGSVGEHALWVLARRGFPRDLNLAYAVLPRAYDDMAQGAMRGLAGLGAQPGGWYNVAIAAWLHAVGPSGPAFAAVSVLWTALSLVAVAGLGRAWGGRWAGATAAAVVAQIPFVSLSTRAGWVHAPEAALTLVGAWALTADPGGRRWRTALVLALTGAAVITLRPSGLFWVAGLGVAAAVARWRTPERGRVWVWGGVVTAWAATAAVPLPLFGAYLHDKLGLRARYGAAVAGLPEQLGVQLQPVAGALVAVGVGLLLAGVVRGARSGTERPFVAAALIAPWLAAPPALYALFHTGVDNFPLLHVALGLLAGMGWAAPLRWSGGATARIAPAVAALPLLAWAVGLGAAVQDHAGPRAPDAADRLRALLDATCPGRARGRTCVVLSDASLFYPQSEEPGTLELFLMGERRVRLVHVHQRQLAQSLAPAAFGSWTCGADDARGVERYPTLVADRAALVQRWNLAPAWHAPALPGEPPDCTYWWLTPGGALARPDALPDGGTRGGADAPAWMPPRTP